MFNKMTLSEIIDTGRVENCLSRLVSKLSRWQFQLVRKSNTSKVQLIISKTIGRTAMKDSSWTTGDET